MMQLGLLRPFSPAAAKCEMGISKHHKKPKLEHEAQRLFFCPTRLASSLCAGFSHSAMSANADIAGGHIIVDCFVPDETLPDQLTDATHRSTSTGEILSRWKVDRDAQVISGVFTQVSGDAANISRPYSVRYATVAQVDFMAHEAGLVVEQRWSSYAHDVFTDSSVRQITVYGIAPSASS
jgi:hypothetical protein